MHTTKPSHYQPLAPTEAPLRKYFQISYDRLQAIRWAAVCFYAVNQLIAMSQYPILHSCFFSVAYLTNWGYLLCFLFTSVLLQTRLDEQLTHRMGHVFHILLAVQFLITSFFWAVIFPTTVHENGVVLYIDCVKHIFPMAHMFVEFLFNNIVFDRSSLRRFKAFLLTYLSVNFLLVRVFEFEIYTMITWRS